MSWLHMIIVLLVVYLVVWLAGASSFSFCGSDNKFLVPSELPKCLKHEQNPQLRFSFRESLMSPFSKAKE